MSKTFAIIGVFGAFIMPIGAVVCITCSWVLGSVIFWTGVLCSLITMAIIATTTLIEMYRDCGMARVAGRRCAASDQGAGVMDNTSWNGVPKNRERDDWHWLSFRRADNEPIVWEWNAHRQEWYNDGRWVSPQSLVEDGWRVYHSRCLTPTEVVAREREAWKERMEVVSYYEDLVEDYERAEHAAAEKARADALEEAAQRIEPRNPPSDWTDFAKIRAEAAQAIRALAKPPAQEPNDGE